VQYCVLITRWFLAAPFVFPAFLWPAPVCRNCHLSQAEQWLNSAHAHALKPVTESLFSKSLPPVPIGESRGGYLLDFTRAGTALLVTASRGSQRASARIDWVVGAGRRAETPLAVVGAKAIEFRISYYATRNKFDLTMGHPRGTSASPESALGLPQTMEDIRRCFGCHGTGEPPRSLGHSSGLEAAGNFQPGIGCPACHSGAQEHAADPSAKTIPAPRSAYAAEAVCERCHRAEPEGDPDDLINIRYQAVRLKRSKCFAAGGLSCINCHDPHANASPDPAWYRSRCLTCHPGQKNQGDCLPCHMSKAAVMPGLLFTDHWIRINH
jgi:hypothetical protein